MDFRKKRLSCAEAKEQDLIIYLSTLGYEPAQIKGNDYWFLSPFRAEQTASFKVDKNLNRWYDHGMGKGGNLIDFAILYHDCTVADFLQREDISFPRQSSFSLQSKIAQTSEPKIEITGVRPIISIELLNYLRERKISIPIADLYCKEITYKFYGSSYYALGFKNDVGGYEIRNRHFKGSSSPKQVTSFNNGAQTVAVFEGFFDFLSYLTMTAVMDVPVQDFLVLNSLAFFEFSIPLLEQYQSIRMFVDNDPAGRNCVQAATIIGLPVTDESSSYKNYKDLNDFLTRKIMQQR